MCSERNAAVVFGRLLSNGGVGVKGGAKCLQICEEGFAVAIRLTERRPVVQIVAALDEVEAGDGFEQRADGDSQKTILPGVALSRGAFRALSNAKLMLPCSEVVLDCYIQGNAVRSAGHLIAQVVALVL